MPVPRPTTTPRRGRVRRARTTAVSARAPRIASSATLPTTSPTEHVRSWSVEKVNKVTALFTSWFFFYLLCYAETTLQSTVSLLSTLCALSISLSDCFSHCIFPPHSESFPFFSGEVEDPDYDDCMACEEGCSKCVLCKSGLSSHNTFFPK